MMFLWKIRENRVVSLSYPFRLESESHMSSLRKTVLSSPSCSDILVNDESRESRFDGREAQRGEYFRHKKINHTEVGGGNARGLNL